MVPERRRRRVSSGFDPVTYLSGEEFLADETQAEFDCPILDIQLGGMSGIELRERLLASGSQTPVIFLTAHDESAASEQALRSMCVAYLRKSDPGTMVLAAVGRAVRVDDKPVPCGRTKLADSESAAGSLPECSLHTSPCTSCLPPAEIRACPDCCGECRFPVRS